MDLKFRAWDRETQTMINVTNIRLWSDGGVKEISQGDEYTLMQWTGLKDFNGKDIYVGDIVIKKLKVNRHDITVGSFEPFEVKYLLCGFNLNFMSKHTCEIIGNIYKDKDLVNYYEL